MTSAAWCAAIIAVVRLCAGRPVPEANLNMACAEIECEMVAHHADLRFVADTATWQTIPLLMDGVGFSSAFVRMTDRGGECLTDPRSVVGPITELGAFAGWRIFYVPMDSLQALGHKTFVCLDLIPVTIADDARRRVLARELYGLLPEEMRCN